MANRPKPTRVYVDTNIFLRFLTGDPPREAERSRMFLEDAERSGSELHISHLTIAEIAWTLRRFYGMPRTRIAESVADLLDLRSIRVPGKGLVAEAVDNYGRRPADFIDAYHAADMKNRGIRAIYSYDRDFDKLGVRRIEP